MTGKPSPSPGDAIGLGVADLKVSTCAASSRGAFKSKPLESHARDIRATFWVEENFSQAFFLPLFGPGKIPGEAFFCHGFGERCRRGGCWGCAMSAPVVWGL